MSIYCIILTHLQIFENQLHFLFGNFYYESSLKYLADNLKVHHNILLLEMIEKEFHLHPYIFEEYLYQLYNYYYRKKSSKSSNGIIFDLILKVNSSKLKENY